MSAINSNINSNSDIDSEKSDNNIISSDSASTFEFIDGNQILLNDSYNSDNLRSTSRPIIWSSTKEEKQKHNEEIVMESAHCDVGNNSSWEKIEIDEIQKEELESCRNFLMNEKAFSSNSNNEISRPSTSTKPCFIDASSLLDDDYIPTSFNTSSSHRIETGFKDDSSSSSLNFNRVGDSGINENPSSLNLADNIQRTHDIKDQFSAIPHYHIPRNFRPNNNSREYYANNDHSIAIDREHERQQGHLIFHQTLPPHSTGRIAYNDDYSSDISFPSEYSSGSTCGTSGTFNNHLMFENTSGYSGSTNYSRLQSDVDSITMPDTPFNSIVQVAKKLEVCAINNSDDEYLDTIRNYHRNTSSPVQIPKRVMKHDESAPILSGGASVIDFVPKQYESPTVRRKTDSCPIVSGGSLDIEEKVLTKSNKSVVDKERSSFSWIVDLKNDLKVEDAEDVVDSDDKKESDEQFFPKNPTCDTPKNSLGFYVDFNSLEPVPEVVVAKPKNENLRKQSLKKSTGFYVDFSSSDISCPNTPKQTKKEELKIVERCESSESSSNDSKKNIFNMFVELENIEQTKSIDVKEKKEEIAECSIKNNKPQQNIDETPKKGCFMFIENDSHVVKHRKILPKEPSKRHSWNVNQSTEYDDIKSSTKVYQRSTSTDDDKMIPSSLPTIPSKTSSMSIGSSLSPHEDFSCSKSLSSRSNLTISTSNTSIDNSETKVQFDDADKKLMRKRRKEAKINETYDKSSQGSITDEIFSNNDLNTNSSSDTDDVTFQNPKEYEEEEMAKKEPTSLLEEIKSKMDTIVETSENSSPFKRANNNAEKCADVSNEVKIEQPPLHTMESLQQLIEKQKQILENETTSLPFVKLSDLDKPPNKKEYPLMTNSAGFRVSSLLDSQRNQNMATNETKSMSRSTGYNIVNLASSVENSKSLSRLFPHLSKVFSSSVPSNVGFNINSNDQSLYEYIEFISSDFSCTSSINSSRSGMESADESTISCRQPRRLGEDLLKMFLQEIGTDVTIDVNGRRIKAHKIILSSRCQFFAAMLAGKWIENSGNIINLTGYSYNVVHFALCHVYSGMAHVPCGLDLMELASLSDYLGLEGLKEVTCYALKTNYCHNFHKPCSGCIDGVLEVLPVSLDHGFDDLYRKCLKWVCKHFRKVWTTKSFANLQFDIQLRCSQQISAHLTSENVLDWILDCEEVLKTLENARWNAAFELQNIVTMILDSAYEYILDHFASLIASDSFLSLGHDRKDVIFKLEHSILKAAASLSPEQACKSYPRAVRLNALLNAKLIKFPPSPLSNESFKPFDRIQLRDEDEEIQWNDEFIKLVSALLSAIEQVLIQKCSRAMKCSAWLRMDADLRSKIQKIACVTESDDMRKTLRSSVNSLGTTSLSSSSNTTTRANDLRQVKLVIEQNSNFSYDLKKYKATTRDYKASNIKYNVKPKIQSTRTTDQSKTINNAVLKAKVDDQKNHSQVAEKNKFVSIKARYMEPRKPRLTLSDISTNSAKSGIKKLSSSDNSTRESSPAFAKKKSIDLMKKSSNLSLDSLQSPAKHKKSISSSNLPKKDSEISMDSLMESKSSQRTDRTSSESLIKRNMNENLRNSARIKQAYSNQSSTTTTTTTSTNPVQRSFLSQKSREILSKKSQNVRKLSINSNSSIATKSTKSSSPKMIPINKSHSTTAVISGKKVYSTTLHLRKTSKLPESLDLKNFANSKIQKKEIPSKFGKEKGDKGNSKLKMPTNNKKDNNSITSDTSKDELFENKMARSNTFSKETSDNPIELLKTMN